MGGASPPAAQALGQAARGRVGADQLELDVGAMCSAVPMVADMMALRRVPPRFFGVFMSVNPVFAALTGLLVLGQSLGLADWLSVAAIVTASAVSVNAGGRVRGPGRRPQPQRAPAGQPAGQPASARR